MRNCGSRTLPCPRGDLEDGLASVRNSSLQWASISEWLTQVRRWNPRHPRLAELAEEVKAAEHEGESA